jgi:hypothetical protein
MSSKGCCWLTLTHDQAMKFLIDVFIMNSSPVWCIWRMHACACLCCYSARIISSWGWLLPCQPWSGYALPWRRVQVGGWYKHDVQVGDHSQYYIYACRMIRVCNSDIHHNILSWTTLSLCTCHVKLFLLWQMCCFMLSIFDQINCALAEISVQQTVCCMACLLACCSNNLSIACYHTANATVWTMTEWQ